MNNRIGIALILVFVMITAPFAHAAITLTITRADNSVYWVEHFDKQSQGDKWLATEKTRSYWNPTYVAAFSGAEDVPDVTAIAARQALVTSQAARLNAIKAMKDAPTLTPAQQTQILQHLLKIQVGE